jgi:hypothetical protein
LNNKIVSTKKTSALFLSIVLVAGTIAAISPLFIINGANAQGYQPYYGGGMDTSIYHNDDRKSYDNKRSYGNDYGYDKSQNQPASYKPDYKPVKDDKRDKSKDSKVDINKLKCINTNLNINGENAGNVNIGNKGGLTEEGYLGDYSSGGSGYDDGEGYYDNGYNKKKDKGIDCIINNNNTNSNIGGGGNQTIPPEPSKATLNVTKLVTCEDTTLSVVAPVDRCAALEQLITEDQFLIQVTDDNPISSQFPGSESGTVVTLGAGNYVVTETDDPSVLTDLGTLLQQFNQGGGGPFFIQRAQSLTGDCTQVLLGGQATGTIGAGESQTCDIENSFTIGRQMT